jgi:hypothetical protein
VHTLTEVRLIILTPYEDKPLRLFSIRLLIRRKAHGSGLDRKRSVSVYSLSIGVLNVLALDMAALFSWACFVGIGDRSGSALGAGIEWWKMARRIRDSNRTMVWTTHVVLFVEVCSEAE